MSPTRNDNTKIQKIQKPNWNQKIIKSNGFTVLLFFLLQHFWMVITLQEKYPILIFHIYLPMSPTRNDNTKIQKIQKPNWNQKVIKSNGFTVLLFFLLQHLWMVITSQEKYPILIFRIVDRCHLLGMRI
jgi:hypothetical protein